MKCVYILSFLIYWLVNLIANYFSSLGIPRWLLVTSRYNFLHIIPKLLLALSTGTITNLSWGKFIYLHTSVVCNIHVWEDFNVLGKQFSAFSISRVMRYFQESKMILLLFAKWANLLVKFPIASWYKWVKLCSLHGGVSKFGSHFHYVK